MESTDRTDPNSRPHRRAVYWMYTSMPRPSSDLAMSTHGKSGSFCESQDSSIFVELSRIVLAIHVIAVRQGTLRPASPTQAASVTCLDNLEPVHPSTAPALNPQPRRRVSPYRLNKSRCFERWSTVVVATAPPPSSSSSGTQRFPRLCRPIWATRPSPRSRFCAIIRRD